MYNRTFWQDDVKQYDDRFTEATNRDGTITHTPVYGEVFQEGTPQNERTFNNMEEGIFAAHEIGLEVALAVLHQSSDLSALAAAEMLAAEVTKNLTDSNAHFGDLEAKTGEIRDMHFEALIAIMHTDSALQNALTNINAHFERLEGNTETGFSAAREMYYEALLATMHHETTLKGLAGIAGTVTARNTLAYPFNNSGVTVSLSPVRNTTDYSVDTVVLSETGGQAGRVEVYDKLVNGFKLRYTGSAKEISVKYIARGGVY